jgi:hypothetical protein
MQLFEEGIDNALLEVLDATRVAIVKAPYFFMLYIRYDALRNVEKMTVVKIQKSLMPHITCISSWHAPDAEDNKDFFFIGSLDTDSCLCFLSPVVN